MGYELIGENDILNPRKQILKNRGITEELLNVGEEAVEDYEHYDNIIEGCELLMKHIEEGNKILIIMDSDVDGLTSSSLLINYICEVFPTANIVSKYHEGKQHGLEDTIDEVIEWFDENADYDDGEFYARYHFGDMLVCVHYTSEDI